jgi:hypothetical protein
LTLPSKVPLKTNAPVSVPPDKKQGVEVVKLRFVTVTAAPLLWFSEVVKPKAGDPSGLLSVAVQLPSMVFGLLELPVPHAVSVTPSTHNTAILKCCMR